MWYFESRRLWRLEAPTQARGLGSADAPSGVQGQTCFEGPGSEAPGSKMNSTFWHCQKLPFLREILKSLTSWKAVLLFYLFILDNFWSRKFWYFFYLEILKSRALQMPFPTFFKRYNFTPDRHHNRAQENYNENDPVLTRSPLKLLTAAKCQNIL